MKFLFLILTTMAFISSASAEITQLGEGDLSMQPISASNIEVRNQKVACGPACTGVISVVKLAYNLSGCLDRLVSFNSVKDNGSRQVTVYVTALNIFTEASTTAKCIVAPTAVETISLPGLYSSGDVEVVFVGVN